MAVPQSTFPECAVDGLRRIPVLKASLDGSAHERSAGGCWSHLVLSPSRQPDRPPNGCGCSALPPRPALPISPNHLRCWSRTCVHGDDTEAEAQAAPASSSARWAGVVCPHQRARLPSGSSRQVRSLMALSARARRPRNHQSTSHQCQRPACSC